MKQENEQDAEPVAWISHDVATGRNTYDRLPLQSLQPGAYKHTPLYASPPKRKPLTNEQILHCILSVVGIRPMGITRDIGPYGVTEPTPFAVWFARAIERAHGIGDE